MTRRSSITRRKNDPAAEDAAAPPVEAAPVAPEPAPAPAPAKTTSRRRVGVDTAEPAPAPAPTPNASPAPAAAPQGMSALEALASGDGDMMAALLQDAATTAMPDVGDAVRGTVARITRSEVLLEVGLKAEAWLDREEVPDAVLGDTIEAFVLHASELGLRLSTRLQGDAAADHLRTAFEQDLPVAGTVKRRNKGGYEVDIGGVRAFCPLSHISRLPLSNPDAVVDTEVTFRVLEMSDDKTVVSAKAHEELAMEGLREKTWSTLAADDVREGTVMRVLAWGAFVDIDGVEGLLPRSNFSWTDVDDLTQHLARGDRLSVRVVSVDRAEGKLSLTTRDPSLDPWSTLAERFSEGEVYQGQVMRTAEFGAFVKLTDGIQGLLHIRFLPDGLPAVGTQMSVRLLSMEPERRRLSLAPPSVDPALQAQNTAGVDVEGTVVEVRDNGIVVQLDDGRRGWLHQGDVELPPGTVLAQRFRRGHRLKARIRDVDPGRDRITLSQKADDSAERKAWRQHMGKQSGQSMGTLGDLLSGFGKK